ncbi:hypothetical protein DUI87_07611 [Hirundo rustica rustica]|uniref:Uncharacterized protein n=1 Tax=Hirundo rustica rustica TaxID=333673 RepID=A0A3M0KXA4_HIRRU|nr:hypothetical protein DUI87_07611 [Hirundo rustica rustica]
MPKQLHRPSLGTEKLGLPVLERVNSASQFRIVCALAYYPFQSCIQVIDEHVKEHRAENGALCNPSSDSWIFSVSPKGSRVWSGVVGLWRGKERRGEERRGEERRGEERRGEERRGEERRGEERRGEERRGEEREERRGEERRGEERRGEERRGEERRGEENI